MRGEWFAGSHHLDSSSLLALRFGALEVILPSS